MLKVFTGRRPPGTERERAERKQIRHIEREREKVDLLYFSLFISPISPNRTPNHTWICLFLSSPEPPCLCGLITTMCFYYRLSHVNSEQDVNEQQTAWRTEKWNSWNLLPLPRGKVANLRSVSRLAKLKLILAFCISNIKKRIKQIINNIHTYSSMAEMNHWRI